MASRLALFRSFVPVLAALAAAPAILRASDAKIVARALASGGKSRSYVLHVPADLPADRPAPLLVTLHGSGRDGRSLVSRWQNEFFPIADARATVEALKADGFPAEIVEMRFHDHEYASSSATINSAAWEFLSRTALATDPKYAEYRTR